MLITALALIFRDSFRSTDQLFLAASSAVAVATLGWFGRRIPGVLGALFLADLGWVSLAVLGAGRAEAGLGLLFAFVAFAAGLCLGGRLSLGISLAAGLAMVVTANGVSDLGMDPSWVLIQGSLVLVLGMASDRIRVHLMVREKALAVASRALERMRLDTDTIVENLGSGILSVNRDGHVVHCNRVAEKTLGIRAATSQGKRVQDVLPEGANSLIQVLGLGLEKGRRVPRSEVELHFSSKTIPLGVSTTVLSDESGATTGVVALFQDLTEVRGQELKARKREKLAVVGELAAGIAHEIRNSVLPIRGSVQMLAQELELKPEQAKLFDVVEREMENIERFVSGLLRYTRRQDPNPSRLDLKTLAAEAAEDVRLFRRGRRITVEGTKAPVWADEDQIRQAVRNLALNAADAVGEDGSIVVRTGTEKKKSWIEIEDNGPGIDPKDRSRVLVPFYTSKPGGTGLGLAVVSRIVEDHQGRLQILDGQRGGVRFRITLSQEKAALGVVPHAA